MDPALITKLPLPQDLVNQGKARWKCRILTALPLKSQSPASIEARFVVPQKRTCRIAGELVFQPSRKRVLSNPVA